MSPRQWTPLWHLCTVGTVAGACGVALDIGHALTRCTSSCRWLHCPGPMHLSAKLCVCFLVKALQAPSPQPSAALPPGRSRHQKPATVERVRCCLGPPGCLYGSPPGTSWPKPFKSTIAVSPSACPHQTSINVPLVSVFPAGLTPSGFLHFCSSFLFGFQNVL